MLPIDEIGDRMVERGSALWKALALFLSALICGQELYLRL